ncbi:MAG: hypothetical protein LBG98_03915 [Puniceicoccales bacterium]|jgi:hypothetical protein|nr:hypothetical protein [Puniceicoccales bacterium]
MIGRKSINIALCASALGSIVCADPLSRSEMVVALDIVSVLPNISSKLEEYVGTLPGQANSKVGFYETQSFWEGIPDLFGNLATADLDGLNAVFLKETLESENTPEDFFKNCVKYGKDFFAFLKQKDENSPLILFVKNLKAKVWNVIYDTRKAVPTVFGNNLHKAYGQSLTAFIDIHHISSELKSLLYTVLNNSFGKKGVTFSGTSVGWIPEPVEALFYIFLDFKLLYDLGHGQIARIYNRELLVELEDFIKLFFQLHIVRFSESLTEAAKIRELVESDMFALDKIGIPVFDGN